MSQESNNETRTPSSELPEEQRLASKANYMDLFLRSIDGILLTDLTSGKILEANDTAVKIFRSPLEKLEGTAIFDYCAPEFLAEFKKMIRIAARRFHPKTFEVPLVLKTEQGDLPIITELAASPLKLKNETEVLQLIFRDITEKKEAERKIAEYIKKIEELATTDGMTGLTNFRQFTNLIDAEHQRAVRYNGQYAVIFFDIDHFKKYNDRNGHPAGDTLLKAFAQLLKKIVRNTDTAARYGGEEFVVLCPETKIEDATKLAERIREAVQAAGFEHAEHQPLGFVSASVGVSAFPQDGKEWKQVLKASDDVLYLSKAGGRNRVTTSLGEGKNPPIPQSH